MILLISRSNDRTTTEVMKWLSVMGKPYIRIGDEETFEIRTAEKRIFIESEWNRFFIDEISSVWYRRGGIRFKRRSYANNAIHMHMNETQHWLEDYVLKTLESKRHINKQSNVHVNKLLVLERAQQVGLDVPAYFLAENTAEVALGETITKSINGNVMLEGLDEDFGAIMYTTIIDKAEEDDFLISFFQEKIEKDFEIRSFYLNGKTWSMAIFSQNDAQTQTDLRKYNTQKPNRNVSYRLPGDIEEKVRLLMQSLDLNCGSLDFIKSGDQYYFLEVNTVGQFENVSMECNYQLEREIAHYL